MKIIRMVNSELPECRNRYFGQVRLVRRFWDKLYFKVRMPMAHEIAILVRFDEKKFKDLSDLAASGELLQIEYAIATS